MNQSTIRGDSKKKDSKPDMIVKTSKHADIIRDSGIVIHVSNGYKVST
jgi:hypothetical protein